MKIKTEPAKSEQVFEPFDLTLTFENEDEMTALYCILSYMPIVEWFYRETGFNPSAIRAEIKKQHGECPKYRAMLERMPKDI